MRDQPKRNNPGRKSTNSNLKKDNDYKKGRSSSHKNHEPKEHSPERKPRGKHIIIKKSNATDKDSSEKRYSQKPFKESDKKRYSNDKRQNLKTDSKRNSLIPGDKSIRLNKYIATAGICSRREADKLIESGVIKVNGKVVTELGSKVSPGDTIQYNGQTLQGETLRYVLLNKPKGLITTLDDPQERDTVMLIIKSACKERIYPVGRLDRNTTGLLLFTNDGDLAKKLTHPKHRVKKVYHVELDKPLTKNDMISIADGVELDDGFIAPDAIAYAESGDDKKKIGIEIHSGRNRIVRRMFEKFGYDVRKLDRVVFANLTKKDLPRGKWRHLSIQEINILRRIN
jgi:23S rRNA pseudouridine2605 synthase